jgi:hypothetical protein
MPCPPRIIQYYFAGQEASIADGQNCFVREVAKTGNLFRFWCRSDKVGNAEAVFIGMSAAMAGDWSVPSEGNTLISCHPWRRYIRNQILRQKRTNGGNFWNIYNFIKKEFERAVAWTLQKMWWLNLNSIKFTNDSSRCKLSSRARFFNFCLYFLHM